MINKEERRILQIFREQKQYSKNLGIVDLDIYKTLENRIKDLEEIEKEHQKLNGELQEKLTKAEKRIKELEEIIDGKVVQEMGISNLYKED